MYALWQKPSLNTLNATAHPLGGGGSQSVVLFRSPLFLCRGFSRTAFVPSHCTPNPHRHLDRVKNCTLTKKMLKIHPVSVTLLILLEPCASMTEELVTVLHLKPVEYTKTDLVLNCLILFQTPQHWVILTLIWIQVKCRMYLTAAVI